MTPPTQSGTDNTSANKNEEKSDSADSSEKGGLSTKVVIGAAVVALGVFALIGAAVVMLNQGGSSGKAKPKRRPGRFREDSFDD